MGKLDRHMQNKDVSSTDLGTYLEDVGAFVVMAKPRKGGYQFPGCYAIRLKRLYPCLKRTEETFGS